jgi:hypothetical protein
MRKAHPSAKIKTLPEDLQQKIYEQCLTAKYADVIEWLKDELKIIISDSSLSEWFGYYRRKLEIAEAESEAREIEELLKTPGLQLSPEQLSGIGNAIFINRATKTGDAKTFVQVASVIQRNNELRSNQQEHADKMSLAERKLEVKKQELELAQRKVAVLEKRINKAAHVIDQAAAKGGISQQTRQQIRAELGMT